MSAPHVFGSAFAPPAPPPPDIDARLARLVSVFEALAGIATDDEVTADMARLEARLNAVEAPRPGAEPGQLVRTRTAYRDGEGEIARIVETDADGRETAVGTVVRRSGEIDRVEWRTADS